MYANLYTIKWLMQCFLDRVRNSHVEMCTGNMTMYNAITVTFYSAR